MPVTSQVRSSLVARVQQLFFAEADPRSYAALRIGFGFAALCVLIDLWPLRIHLFARSGLVGGGAGLGLGHGPNLFQWIGSDTAVTVFMSVAAVAMVAMIAGAMPRLAAATVYLWAVSYSTTVLTAVAGYDVVLRVVAFTLLISPVVSKWSILSILSATARKSGLPRSRDEVPAYGLRLVQWQVFLIYFSTALLKLNSDDWLQGDVLAYYWMSIFSRFPHPVFADLELLSTLAGWGTLVIELTVPFLLWSRRFRWIGVALGAALHLGIALTSRVALFSLTMLVLYPAFFETRDFDAIARRLPHRAST